MRWIGISKSLIQVQKEEKSSLIELIHVYASPQKREIMQAFSRGSLAVTAKKCTKKCQRCTSKIVVLLKKPTVVFDVLPASPSLSRGLLFFESNVITCFLWKVEHGWYCSYHLLIRWK